MSPGEEVYHCRRAAEDHPRLTRPQDRVLPKSRHNSPCRHSDNEIYGNPGVIHRQGLLLWNLLPRMREDRLRALMTRFGELLRQHVLFTGILGVL
jgi:hypothetical protein